MRRHDRVERQRDRCRGGVQPDRTACRRGVVLADDTARAVVLVHAQSDIRVLSGVVNRPAILNETDRLSAVHRDVAPDDFSLVYRFVRRGEGHFLHTHPGVYLFVFALRHCDRGYIGDLNRRIGRIRNNPCAAYDLRHAFPTE